MSLLYPCRKCGNKRPRLRLVPGSVDEARDYYLHGVICGVCGHEGPHYRNAGDAAKYWNVENWTAKEKR